MWNGLVPHASVPDKNWEGHLICRGPHEEQGVPSPHQALQSRIPMPGREVPITAGCKNHQGVWLSEMEASGVPGSSS